MRIFLSLIACACLISCSSKKTPDGILPPEKMEPILWQQMKADAFTKEYLSKDSSKDPVKENLLLQERIFRQYGTDKKTFYKSYEYYMQHEELMKALLDSVLAIEGRKKEKENENERSRLFKIRKNEQGQKDR